jgi:hypothetical protein
MTRAVDALQVLIVFISRKKVATNPSRRMTQIWSILLSKSLSLHDQILSLAREFPFTLAGKFALTWRHVERGCRCSVSSNMHTYVLTKSLNFLIFRVSLSPNCVQHNYIGLWRNYLFKSSWPWCGHGWDYIFRDKLRLQLCFEYFYSLSLHVFCLHNFVTCSKKYDVLKVTFLLRARVRLGNMTVFRNTYLFAGYAIFKLGICRKFLGGSLTSRWRRNDCFMMGSFQLQPSLSLRNSVFVTINTLKALA